MASSKSTLKVVMSDLAADRSLSDRFVVTEPCTLLFASPAETVPPTEQIVCPLFTFDPSLA